MAWVDAQMAEVLVDFARFLGVPVNPSAYLPYGHWEFSETGSVLIAHDLWEALQIPIFEFDLLVEGLENGEIAPDDYQALSLAELAGRDGVHLLGTGPGHD